MARRAPPRAPARPVDPRASRVDDTPPGRDVPGKRAQAAPPAGTLVGTASARAAARAAGRAAVGDARQDTVDAVTAAIVFVASLW
jgi:hypothetical protein